jgi:hypothetical protein
MPSSQEKAELLYEEYGVAKRRVQVGFVQARIDAGCCRLPCGTLQRRWGRSIFQYSAACRGVQGLLQRSQSIPPPAAWEAGLSIIDKVPRTKGWCSHQMLCE